jgi:PAS domain-containing protein
MEVQERVHAFAFVLGHDLSRFLQLAHTLRSTKERFRLTVEAALDYAIFTTDPQDRITDWLPGAQAVFGWTAEEAIGRPAAITFTPRGPGKPPGHISTDGRRVFIEGPARALRDPDGTLHGFLKIGQDAASPSPPASTVPQGRAHSRYGPTSAGSPRGLNHP